MNRKTIIRSAPLLALLGLPIATGVSADHGGHGGSHDHERAREALDRGEVRPISEILARVAEQVPGEVVDVEFEHRERHGSHAWVYEFKVLTQEGRMLEVLVDGATSQVLRVEDD